MRHRKTKKKVGARKHHRRHRMGAGGKLEKAVLTVVGVVGGAIVAPFLVNAANTALGSNAASIPGPLIPGAVAAAGGAIAYFGEKMPIVEGAGYGMLAVAGVMTANELGLNEPGIAGLAFGNNAPAGSRGLSNAVGCARVNGPGASIQQTVGAMKRRRRNMAVGALISD